MILRFKKVTLFVLIVLVNNTFVSSQELDQDFINSLPNSIKQDVLNQISNNVSKGDVDNKNYSSFDSNISIDDYEEINSDFSNLKVFGTSFFKSYPSTFMPINDPSADANYILDVDDEIQIQMFGGVEDNLRLKIKRSGDIDLPKVGPITLAGLSIGDAKKVVQKKVKEYFIDTDVVVSLSEVRDIKILVTGEVNFPGIYTLSGYSSALHAIGSAGGIKESGSFRKVVVKRNGKIIDQIDLYKIFIDADTSDIKSLRSGDSILVQPTSKTIRVVGAVNRPAIFEYIDGEKAEDVIRFAGGFSIKSQDNLFFISRKSGSGFELLSSNRVSNTFLKDLDRIFVPFSEYDQDNLYLSEENNFLINPVTVDGAIKRPGKYFIDENTTLSELIRKAGGYKDNAYTYGASLISMNAQNLEASYNLKLYNEAIKSLASVSTVANNLNISSLVDVLTEFKKTETIGRVVAEFDLKKIDQDSYLDTKLSPGDKIFIPYQQDRVYIFGEVLNPGTLKFNDGYNVKDYIDVAGGLNKYSDRSSIILVYPNGESERYNLRNFGSNRSDLYPGTVIYIPRDLTFMEGTDLARAIAPILSSLAISLASLNSISNN
tara:strand:+ start:6997 stop:8799 length:1803 start_codon:yes stop_codon:yes gene_type:complete